MRYVKLTLQGIPPSINRFAGKENAWEYRNTKQEWTNVVYLKAKAAHLQHPFERATVNLLYFFPDNRRHDPDNYAGKFLLDGLTKAGVIKDDDFRHINLVIAGDVDRKNPRTEIIVTEC